MHNIVDSTLLAIANDGMKISETNYFDSKMAENGGLYLSWNAGAARLLIPDLHVRDLPEMKMAKEVIVSLGLHETGKTCYELLFEDYTDTPYSIYLSTDQSDRLLGVKDVTIKDQTFPLLVYTKNGIALEFQARFRIVSTIPCLAEWAS